MTYHNFVLLILSLFSGQSSENMDALLQFRIFFFKRCGFFLLMIFGITNQCPESTTTVHYVNSCPQSAEKWTEAAKRLNCQSISTNCTNFVYHCVMDHYRTTLIEVCAPKKLILGIYGVLVFFFYLKIHVL